jgi:DNA-binding NtrC family response regulator
MNIAILTHDYHMLRLAEMLLQREKHTVTCFGKVERLEASAQPFDLLMLDPGRLSAAQRMLERLESWRPDVRRIMFTGSYENVTLARECGMHLLMWPCSRQLFLMVVRKHNVFSEEELSRGT